MLKELEDWFAGSKGYPFLTTLEPAIGRIKKLVKEPYAWYLTDFSTDTEDELLELKEQVLDPIYRFMNGSQINIYDDASKFLRDQSANFDYIEREQVRVLQASLSDNSVYKGSQIQKIKTLLNSLKTKVDEALKQARIDSIDSIRQMQSRMQEMNEYKKLPDIRQSELDAPYTQLIDNVSEQVLIAVINDRLQYFKDKGYSTLLQKMVVMATPKSIPVPAKASNDNDDSNKDQAQVSKPQQVSEPKDEYITSSKINIPYDRAWLENETDVEHYLQAMSQALLNEIRKGKRIYI